MFKKSFSITGRVKSRVNVNQTQLANMLALRRLMGVAREIIVRTLCCYFEAQSTCTITSMHTEGSRGAVKFPNSVTFEGISISQYEMCEILTKS